jgi:peptide/nickel transport system substrate-binding protein
VSRHDLANQLGKPIIPLLLDDNVFVGLNPLQYQDVHGGSTPLATFVNTVRGHLQTGVATGTTRPPPGRPRLVRIGLIAGGTVLAMIAGVVGVVSWLSDSLVVGGPGPAGGGQLRIYTNEPVSLMPTASDDASAIDVIRQIYRGLVKYNNDTGLSENDLAESITSADNVNWTVKIKPGYRFTNGEPVDADAFIRSWNYTAYAPNAQKNAYFMSKIAGITDVSYGADPDGDGPLNPLPPARKDLAGLKKVDDLTFTVRLNSAFIGFPAIVGYSGFFPVAKACLDNVYACAETPIGNGPYKIEGTWQHDVSITLVRNDDYHGIDRGKPQKLIFTIFANSGPGYDAFVAGELDVMGRVPNAKTNDAAATYGDHYYQKPNNFIAYLGFPLYNDAFKDKRIRQALSLAIDRQAINQALFNGTVTPATSLISPNFPSARSNACTYCTYDVRRAKDLLAAAGGWSSGLLQLWTIAGTEQQILLQSIGDQIKAGLGIDYELQNTLRETQYYETAGIRGFTGPFMFGWAPDYPYDETYLAPLYATGGSANSSGYSSVTFDQYLAQANAAKTADDALELYRKAEDVVLADMPIAPLWFSRVAAVYSDNVQTFVYNIIEGVSYGDITLKQ